MFDTPYLVVYRLRNTGCFLSLNWSGYCNSYQLPPFAVFLEQLQVVRRGWYRHVNWKGKANLQCHNVVWSCKSFAISHQYQLMQKLRNIIFHRVIGRGNTICYRTISLRAIWILICYTAHKSLCKLREQTIQLPKRANDPRSLPTDSHKAPEHSETSLPLQLPLSVNDPDKWCSSSSVK